MTPSMRAKKTEEDEDPDDVAVDSPRQLHKFLFEHAFAT